MVNTTEALKLAIDALENTDRSKLFELERNAIAAIKAALAQPNSEYERGFVDGMQKQMQSSVDKAVNRMAQTEQEPVAWMVYTQDGQSVYVTDNPTDIQEGQRALPLYTGAST